jgi:hypothetical protein
MTNWFIDRLALTVNGYSEHDARELARCIADALVQITSVPTRAPARQEHGHLGLELSARDGEATAELARRIVAALAATE